MKIKANLLNKPVNFQMDDCQIEKVVELPRDQFSGLVIAPLTNQPFIAENKSQMFVKNGTVHCLLALGQGSDDGVLIYSAGYDYPRLAACLPGMRDILNASVRRTSSSIRVRRIQRTEAGASASRNWRNRLVSRSKGGTVWTKCCWRRSHAAEKWPRRR